MTADEMRVLDRIATALESLPRYTGTNTFGVHLGLVVRVSELEAEVESIRTSALASPKASPLQAETGEEVRALIKRWEGLRESWAVDNAATSIIRANIYGLCIQQLVAALGASRPSPAERQEKK